MPSIPDKINYFTCKQTLRFFDRDFRMMVFPWPSWWCSGWDIICKSGLILGWVTSKSLNNGSCSQYDFRMLNILNTSRMLTSTSKGCFLDAFRLLSECVQPSSNRPRTDQTYFCMLSASFSERSESIRHVLCPRIAYIASSEMSQNGTIW